MSEIQYCQNGCCPAESVTVRGADDWPLCSMCADAFDAGYAFATPDDLLIHIAEQVAEYKENILPLHPDSIAKSLGGDVPDYQENWYLQKFDDAKNEFLESLWDVILGHYNAS